MKITRIYELAALQGRYNGLTSECIGLRAQLAERAEAARNRDEWEALESEKAERFDLAIAHADEIERALGEFVREFESDFVITKGNTSLIVDVPGERWGPIVRLYEQARAALSAEATDDD